MTGMTLQAIAEACGGILHGDQDNTKEVLGVELDSRRLKEGYLFIATKGERVDGHSFIAQALEKGCYGVVCENAPQDVPIPYILVKDSFKALQDIAAYYRGRIKAKVVGITGSVGKTSTKEVIASALAEKYTVLKTEGNFNNEIGLPLTVLRIREEHEVAVLEMGINHFGEMHRLSRIARPDVCVITNIGQCHLEFLGDRDGVLRAKTEMFDFMNPKGVVCLNGEDDKLITVTEVHGRKPVFFGRGDHCHVRAVNIENLGLEGSKADVLTKEHPAFEGQKGMSEDACSVRMHVPGEHMVMNAMAAVAVGRALGMCTAQIAEGIEKTGCVDGRSNILKDEVFTVIDDCYNANPVSMKSAIALLATAKTRTVAILGDMFELGENEKKLHHEVGSFITDKNIDVVICIGSSAEEIYLAAKEGNVVCYHYRSKADMMQDAAHLLQKGDTILIKASHGMGFTELVKYCSSHTWI